MRPNTNNFFALISLSCLSFTTASHLDTFSSIQCHCISFSPTAKPIACPLPESQNLDWNTARTLSLQHQVKIQFASQDTVSRVLDAATPLPTSVLLSMSNGLPLPLNTAGSLESVDKIVCGIDDEVRQRWMETSEREGGAVDCFALQVIVSLILLIVLYEAVEVSWTSLQSKYFPKKAPIRLTGDEKLLTADNDFGTENHEVSDLEKASSVLGTSESTA